MQAAAVQSSLSSCSSSADDTTLAQIAADKSHPNCATAAAEVSAMQDALVLMAHFMMHAAHHCLGEED
jgi:hypothetical protein